MCRCTWLSLGFFLPLLAALLLVIAVSCGGAAATPTTAPQPEAMEPTAMPTAEPDAMEDAESEGEAPEVQAAPTATPVPVAAATATPVPEAVTAKAEPTGTITVAIGVLGRYTGHTRFAVSGEGHTLTSVCCHEGLVTFNHDAQWEPILAESWSVSPDNRVWTFNLRRGVEYHQGWGPVTPEDVIHSIRELGELDGHCGCVQTKAIFENPDGYFIGLDDYTLELDTVEPVWDLLNWIQAPNCCAAHIFSKTQWDHLVETVGQEQGTSLMVGTGPFELTDDMGTEEWNFKAVRDHWRKTPEFDILRYVAIPEESTIVANFLTGHVDTWQVGEASIPVVAGEPTTKFMAQKGIGELDLIIWQNGYEFVGTDKEWPGYDPDKPWIASDPDLDSEGWERARKVREAMGLAIDRQKIVDELLLGEGEPAALYGWQRWKKQWPEGFEWDYDVERAKQLMKEAGYEDGFSIDMNPADTGGTGTVSLACQAIADMWADINIDATVTNLPTTVIYPAYKARTQQGVTCQANPVLGAEPVVIHRFSFDPNATWGVGWDHPWYTERLLKAYTTFDPDERWALQVEMRDWMRHNALSMAIYGINAVYPLGPNVDSWEEHLLQAETSVLSSLEYAPHRQ